MDCIKCLSTLSIDDSMQCILCNKYIHDKCLFNMLSTECRAQNMPTYFKASLSLPNISFTCDNCINTKLSSIESKSIDNIYSLIKSQTDSLKDQLTTLSNQCTNLIRDKNPCDSLLLNYISNAITNLPDTINSTTSTFFADIVKSVTSSPLNTTPSSSQSSNTSNIYPSIVIEHISTTDRNISYIKSLFLALSLDSNCITSYSFRSHYVNLSLSSPCISDSLLNSRSTLINSSFKNLYVRPYLEPATLKTGRIYFHAHKSSLTELKCVFNKSTNIYELHPLKHRENSSSMYIDWKCDPYILNDEEHSIWSKSLDSYNEEKQKN